MNILEAYIKKYGHLIILILGLPCSNKSEIAKELGIDLNLPIININDYLIKDKYKEITIKDFKFKIYEDPDNYDWDKLNDDVNKSQSTGLIIYGNYIDSNKIDWDIDFSFFYSMNNNLCKKMLIENKFLEKIADSEEKIKIYWNDIFIPLYEELKLNLKIKKYYNLKEDSTFNESYDNIFDYLMELIQQKIK